MDGCPDCQHYEFHLRQLQKLVDTFDENVGDFDAKLLDSPTVKGMKMVIDKVRTRLPKRQTQPGE